MRLGHPCRFQDLRWRRWRQPGGRRGRGGRGRSEEGLEGFLSLFAADTADVGAVHGDASHREISGEQTPEVRLEEESVRSDHGLRDLERGALRWGRGAAGDRVARDHAEIADFHRGREREETDVGRFDFRAAVVGGFELEGEFVRGELVPGDRLEQEAAGDGGGDEGSEQQAGAAVHGGRNLPSRSGKPSACPP